MLGAARLGHSQIAEADCQKISVLTFLNLLGADPGPLVNAFLLLNEVVRSEFLYEVGVEVDRFEQRALLEVLEVLREEEAGHLRVAAQQRAPVFYGDVAFGQRTAQRDRLQFVVDVGFVEVVLVVHYGFLPVSHLEVAAVGRVYLQPL